MGRWGLVLAGGSCRCAFQVGVLQALAERGTRFEVVGAVSSGVWNATGVATGRIAALRELWLGAARFPVYSLRHLRFNKTIWNYLWIHHHFTRHLLGFEHLRESSVEWLVGVTRLRGLKRAVFTNRQPYDPFRVALASNAIPPIYPWPIKLGEHYYIDGGFSDNLIYEEVLARGCERVVIVVQAPDGALWKSPREPRHQLPPALRPRLAVIHPREPLPIGFNDLNPDRIERAIEAGYRAGLTAEL
jgi:predicted acylesterase/phospholipase RssA